MWFLQYLELDYVDKSISVQGTHSTSGNQGKCLLNPLSLAHNAMCTKGVLFENEILMMLKTRKSFLCP